MLEPRGEPRPREQGRVRERRSRTFVQSEMGGWRFKVREGAESYPEVECDSVTRQLA